jgi:hypothetical protein
MDEATATAITEQFGCWKRLKGKLYGGLEHPKQLVSCAMRVLPKPDEYRCDDDQAYLVHKGLSTETVKVSVWAVPPDYRTSECWWPIRSKRHTSQVSRSRGRGPDLKAGASRAMPPDRTPKPATSR